MTGRSAIETLDAHLRAERSPVLVLGPANGPLATRLRARGHVLVTAQGDWPSIQLERRFAVVVTESAATAAPHEHAAVLHCAVQHAQPGAFVVVGVPPAIVGELVRRFDLEEVAVVEIDGTAMRIVRRDRRRTIHDVVFDARSRIARVTATQLAARLDGPSPPTVLDTRTPTDRHRYGVIPGALHVPRTVVEWHLDPANGYRHREISSFDQPLVLVCNGGYSSSLAAASLLDIGFTDVGDLIGGHRSWLEAGLPVVVADHSHLDL